ncbi:amidohydrolase [Bacillus sp. BRMEA1]|uniref:amidohydrolase n=1 Tax=Neobacillus endophyticus TaxID=2738405 RepID=UPI001564A847|nr:amidohydrolase [Neobacillus endophyticus]NRD79427.1 amidohydrolase [Neobacillus endophyticus]
MNQLQYIEQNKESIFQTYHTLHDLAEPSWHEQKTSLYLKEKLKNAGIHIKSFPNHYGFIAEIPGQSDQVIALRADMDALVQEVDGVVKANHSCGHDAHSTMVLYTALAFKASGIIPKYTLRFIFQPAEEMGEGALKMMDEGALKNVNYLFGVHVRPHFEVPYMKAAPIIIHGSAGTIKGTIKGKQAHAARPQDGINVIEAAALIVQKLKQIKLETAVPYSIKMTQLETENSVSNVIPETAHFSIDARAQTNDLMDELKKRAHQIVEDVIHETAASISYEVEEFVPAATRHENAVIIVENAITDILGSENVIPCCISQGGEDFHFYTAKNPQLSATMLGLGCGLAPGLHHPQMNFNIEALHYGAKILTKTLLLALEK